MAEENNNNNPLENRDENNPENRNEEYRPNFARLEPDIGLGDRSQQQEDRKRRNHEANRREDGPISFRHFLQNDTGSGYPTSTTAYPDLYRCSRQERSNPEASVTDPESPVLPDFVQDNLALEHIYFNSDFNSKVLPDFTPYESGDGFRDQYQAGASGHRFDEDSAQASGRSSRNRIPLDLPVPNFLLDAEPQSVRGSALPFDLTTQTGNIASTDDVRSPTETELSGTGGRLPDFLSDGHILGHGNARHRDARIITSENGTGIDANPERRNLIITLREENHRLRDELSILQSVLMKKDDRIKELEDLVMALEISKLQMSSDANTQTMSQNKTSSEDEITILKRELESAKKEISILRKEKFDVPIESHQDAAASSRMNIASREELTTRMKQMTYTSEQLVQQLMKVISDMKSDFNITDEELESFDETQFKGGNPRREQGGPSSSLQ